MIVGVTSKRGGTGCTTLSLVLSYCLKTDYNRKVCIVDLRDNDDVRKLLDLDTQACVDNLLTSYDIHSKFTTIEENTVSKIGVDVIPGVTVCITNYLLKKSEKIKILLDELDKRYDVVILDILDDELLETLKVIGVVVLPVNVLEQNMLVVEEYQPDMEIGHVSGLIVINKTDNSVWPEEGMFRKYFKKNRIFSLPYSPELKTILNKNGLKLESIIKTKFMISLAPICKNINEKIEEYNSGKFQAKEKLSLDSLLELKPAPSKRSQPAKRGFFSSLFGKKTNGGVSK